MARTTRQVSKTGVYHVLLRGDALFQKDEDKQYFEGLLSEYFQTDAILGYLLQENRIHIVIHSDDLSKEIKPLCTAYARYYNRCYSVEGKLFCDRFKSEPLEDEETLSMTLAYIKRFGAKKKKKNEIRRLAMDDYERMSEQELSETVYWLCGIMPGKECSKEEQAKIWESVRESGRLRSGLLRPILGEEKKTAQKPKKAPKAKKSAAPKAEKKAVKTSKPEKAEETPAVAEIPQKEEKPETPKKKKKELSVWLL